MAGIRASDAERERAIVRLREGAAEGRLTFEELADRVEAATLALTRAELERLTEDLPAEPQAAVPGTLDAPAERLTADLPAERPAAGPATVPTRASTVFGDVRREGAWIVPARGAWKSFFGDIVLDVRQATVPAGEVLIDAGTVFGDIDLLVPEGVEVEIRSRTLFGDIKQQAGEAAPRGAPRIVLTGGTVFGDVKVRAKRLRERLRELRPRW